jgi:hypothetical protein
VTQAEHGRHWAWAALIAAVVIGAAFLPTWGFSLLLWPISAAFSVVAWFYSPRDGLFWCGVALNGLLLAGFVVVVQELAIAA